MTKTPHTHKLKRLKYRSGNIIFFCTLPDCNFKINISLALGKRSLCWRCGEPFIMDDYSLRLAKPHCESCHRPKNESVEVFDTIMEGEINKARNFHDIQLVDKLTQAIQAAQQAEDEDEL